MNTDIIREQDANGNWRTTSKEYREALEIRVEQLEAQASLSSRLYKHRLEEMAAEYKAMKRRKFYH
jgi:hypothetical protein